jgi:hypothetical protein
MSSRMSLELVMARGTLFSVMSSFAVALLSVMGFMAGLVGVCPSNDVRQPAYYDGDDDVGITQERQTPPYPAAVDMVVRLSSSSSDREVALGPRPPTHVSTSRRSESRAPPM